MKLFSGAVVAEPEGCPPSDGPAPSLEVEGGMSESREDQGRLWYCVLYE